MLPSDPFAYPLKVLGLACGMLVLLSISEPTWTKDLSQLYFLVCHVESTTVRNALLIVMEVVVFLKSAAAKNTEDLPENEALCWVHCGQRWSPHVLHE